MKNNEARILILDIETAPAKCYSWGLFDQNIGINQVVEDGYVLCWCAKWLGDPEILNDSLIKYPDHFKKNPRDDSRIAKSIWKLMDQADIVVTHNGNSFDLKWLNTMFIKAGLPPASPHKSIDTCLEVRKNFRFLSNKLDFLCRKLEIGYKINTGGFELWEQCMHGDRKSWASMITYCEHDVRILERLYLKIRPYMKSHPNLNLYRTVDKPICPNCGSTHLVKKGWAYTKVSKYQRFQCTSCGTKTRGTARESLSDIVVGEL